MSIDLIYAFSMIVVKEEYNPSFAVLSGFRSFSLNEHGKNITMA